METVKIDQVRKGTLALVLASPALAASLCLPVLLGGCIASYSIRQDEPNQAAPDAALVCRYNWSVDEPYFRSEGLVSYHWGPPTEFGHHDFAAALRDLTGECPASNAADRPDARISAHALHHANKYTRGAAVLPASIAVGYTLGFIPLPATDYFAVCLEIKSKDGLRHAAIAQGRLDSFANKWGFSKYKQERIGNREQIVRDLTVQAWHKAWNPAQSESGTIGDCRDALDAIVGRSPNKNAK